MLLSGLLLFVSSVLSVSSASSSQENDIIDSLAQSLQQIVDTYNITDVISDQKSCSCQSTQLHIKSCKEIKSMWPKSPSQYYIISSKGETRQVYCNMEELCGSGGGWTRLAYLNMTDSMVNCPSGFKLYQSGGVRACGRPSGDCTSVQFPSNGISYSQVCGRVVGYQYITTDAVDTTLGTNTSHNDINSYYVDGVSITRGSPRQHVWTLMAGFSEASSGYVSRFNCPCSVSTTQNASLQSFIGNDYFCESGNPATDESFQHILYTSDPLWDGKKCGVEGNCCTAPGLPWFHKVLNTTTTDYLELRVCGDQEIEDENAPVSFYEIYVK